jgi:hypothetical protein
MPPMCCRENDITGATQCVQVRSCSLDCRPPGRCTPHAFECFVRNVFTRYLAELILDVGTPSTTGIVGSIPEVLLAGLPSISAFEDAQGEESRPRGDAVVQLTDERRLAVAQGAGERILELAATYQTQVDFRTSVLEGTQLGDQLVELYHRFLPSIWEVARSRFDLFERCRALWMRTHPFVAEVVALARSADDSTATSRDDLRRLSSEDFDELARIAAEFSDDTEDAEFRAVIRASVELIRQFVGMSSLEILEFVQRSEGPFRWEDTDGISGRAPSDPPKGQ